MIGNAWEWLADTSGEDGLYIGMGYNISFGIEFGRIESRKQNSPDQTVGFRVLLVPNETVRAGN